MKMLDYVYAHRFLVGFVVWSFASSGIVTMPEPGKPFSVYAWVYAWAHQFLNTRGLTPKPPV